MSKTSFWLICPRRGAAPRCGSFDGCGSRVTWMIESDSHFGQKALK